MILNKMMVQCLLMHPRHIQLVDLEFALSYGSTSSGLMESFMQLWNCSDRVHLALKIEVTSVDALRVFKLANVSNLMIFFAKRVHS
jgi:hypothetical protein